MPPDRSWCTDCIRGFYSCHWKSSSKSKHAGCWLSVVAVVTLLSLCWMYIWLVAFNDQEDVNWKMFTKLKQWVNWFMVLTIISALLTSYCIVLLLFALFQVALGERLNLHWLHKILLLFGVAIIACVLTGITLQWRQEWSTVHLSLQATGPFLQFGAVGALTLLSPFIFRGFHKAQGKWSKILLAVAFLAVSGAIFLCPLSIPSPCLMEDKQQVPEKPKLFGHRGAPMLAPENTMMSFNRSVSCGVAALETDVQLSEDRVPFLMHDSNSSFLLRTTNAKEKFPEKYSRPSSNFTWQELQSLNAGQWFLEKDPFLSASKLSKEEVETARNQSIPSLLQLLSFAQQHNISVMFDLYSHDNDTEDVVNTTLTSGIDPGLILWLPPGRRDYVMQTAPGFIQVYNNPSDMSEKKGKHLNMKYSNLSMKKIRSLREENVTVNLWVVNEPWLFSLLWCAGASSVTTNACHLLQDMKRPDWVMELHTYKIIWITLDVISILIMTGIFMIQWKTHGFCCRPGTKDQRDCIPVWNDKELWPFLPVP